MAAKKKKQVVKKQAVKDKGGRPTAFKIEYLSAIYKLCELGATDSDLADAFGVTRGTINNWKKKHPEVFIHIKSGKDDANEKVKMSLYNRAIGMSVKETKLASFEGEFTDSKQITKNYLPDVTACEIWLINRDPENWKSRNADRATGDNDKMTDVLTKLIDKLPN